MKTGAFVVAGTHSGSGKTTVTLALMSAFGSMNYSVQGFKVGPDYIDPSLHRIITKRPSVNLDSWMMPEQFLRWTFSRHARNSRINIVEGVMGLFDSRSAISDDGSTAQVSKLLGLPVILVVNAASMARSAAAVVKGFAEFDNEVKVAGIIFNNVGSEKHLKLLADSVAKYCNVPVVGGLQRENQIELPSRHLGLFMGEDRVLSVDMIKKLSELAKTYLDLELLEKISEVPLPVSEDIKIRPLFSQKKKMAIAMDNAFCFYYRDNLEILKKWGFELTFFSPMEDKQVPDGIDAVYFGGGYPELYADVLSANKQMKESVRSLHEGNTSIYAECGGLMYLGKAIENQEGKQFPMCGILPFGTRVLSRFKSLGYVEIEPLEDFLFLKRGRHVRGHEFHYSEIVGQPSGLKNIYLSTPPGKSTGYRIKNTLASYVHLHFSRLLF